MLPVSKVRFVTLLAFQHSGPEPTPDDICSHACIQQKERDGNYNTCKHYCKHYITENVFNLVCSCPMGFCWEWWELMWL